MVCGIIITIYTLLLLACLTSVCEEALQQLEKGR